MVNKKQNSAIATLFIIIMQLIQMSCTAETPEDLSKESIIPKPVSITTTGESFTLKAGTDIYIQGESDELKQIGQYLADRLKPATGFGFEVKSTSKAPRAGNIYLTTSAADAKLGEEGYELTITKKLVKLAANGPAGLFRGIQTIRQLLPANIELTAKQDGPWKISTGTIIDYPVYSYRGAMLDVSRHFFGVDDVKRFIDFLALYKMNVLHLHLSDDQGWRIEIKSWPNLTAHGGSTQVGGGKGGYYTQEQYTEIVNYAKERYIMVVPEIDMPGHTNAALASYAELNCNGKATELYTGTRVGFSSLCTGKEITYKFIDDVVRELAALTPGPYIHIGGDESNSTKKEDYIPFINRVQEIVLSHGKQVIGWDDISIASLKPNVVAQHWANVKNANMAVGQGAKILMSPAIKAYLDMQYDKNTPLGLHWAAYIEVDNAYKWDPATLVPGVEKENVLGIEAPLWTETITKMDDIEYMGFPRLPGYAEIGWTPSSARNWDEYKVRLGKQGERFKAMDINFYPSGLVPWVGAK
ncbi:MAG: beta-N-acetylhexosaminidase [Bacteroidales bacterium]|nr:beta-N-acetylhexosaminidase [Bacteroidales bacterium]